MQALGMWFNYIPFLLRLKRKKAVDKSAVEK
jgi:hypothetical protein